MCHQSSHHRSLDHEIRIPIDSLKAVTEVKRMTKFFRGKSIPLSDYEGRKHEKCGIFSPRKSYTMGNGIAHMSMTVCMRVSPEWIDDILFLDYTNTLSSAAHRWCSQRCPSLPSFLSLQSRLGIREEPCSLGGEEPGSVDCEVALSAGLAGSRSGGVGRGINLHIGRSNLSTISRVECFGQVSVTLTRPARYVVLVSHRQNLHDLKRESVPSDLIYKLPSF
jgi:hypothetical protein